METGFFKPLAHQMCAIYRTLSCFQGRLIKLFGELITFFCKFTSLLAPEPFAILQKIRYTDFYFLNVLNFPDVIGGSLLNLIAN